MTRREEALALLLADGAVLGKSGDVKALRTPSQRGQKVRTIYGRIGQCGRKRRHATEAEARKVAKKIGNVDVRPYRCEYCRGWHNGNPPQTKALRTVHR